MPDSPMWLTPDDDQQATVNLSEQRAQRQQPYALVAVMVGMVLLLLLRGIFPDWSGMSYLLLFNVALIVAVIAYAVCVAVRPQLPYRLLAMIAAVLGALYGLPYAMVFGATGRLFIGLLFWLIISGVVGALVSSWMKVDEYPEYILPLNFLLLFVLVNLTFIFLI